MVRLGFHLHAGAVAAAALLAVAGSAWAKAEDSLWIAQPASGATVRNAAGNLDVDVATARPLDVSAGDSVQLLLDGKVVADSSDGQRFRLLDLPNGRHTVVAELRDGHDRVLAHSAPVVVHVAPVPGTLAAPG
jgi:hypothetical protein